MLLIVCSPLLWVSAPWEQSFLDVLSPAPGQESGTQWVLSNCVLGWMKEWMNQWARVAAVGVERGRCLHPGDIRHWALSAWGLWVTGPHAFPAPWLFWEDTSMYLALCTVHHTDLQTWEPRWHSGRRRKVSGPACAPHQMVAFLGNGTQRWLSEWLVSSQIGFKGVIMKDWQQLLEWINTPVSEREASTLDLNGSPSLAFSLCASRIPRETGSSMAAAPASSPEPGLWEGGQKDGQENDGSWMTPV